jgi:hypothetical protein
MLLCLTPDDFTREGYLPTRLVNPLSDIVAYFIILLCLNCNARRLYLTVVKGRVLSMKWVNLKGI